MQEEVVVNEEIEVSSSEVMSVRPIVSVLMVTYNHGAFIAEAIEGVIRQQTNFPVELIIGEDCSPDTTRAIVLDYQHRYPHLIRVVYSGQNVGGCNNLIRCFNKSRGEFIAYCEGDDYWQAPLKLQKQVDFLRANPSYSMVHSDYDRIVFSFGRWRRIAAINQSDNKNILQGNIYHQLLTSKVGIVPCTFLGRYSLLMQHLPSVLNSPNYPVGDLPVKLRMSKLGGVGYINESLGSYRRAPGSVMNSESNKKLLMRKRMMGVYQDFTREFGASESEWMEIQRVYHRKVWWAAINACSTHDVITTWAWLVENDPEYAGRLRYAIWTQLGKMPGVLQMALRLRDLMREIELFLKSKNK